MVVLTNVPTPGHCSQHCTAARCSCQSFNFYHQRHVCEMNSCLNSPEFEYPALESDSTSAYYSLQEITAIDCASQCPFSDCHPVFTKSCSDGMCVCHGHASGPDCSQVSLCSEETCWTVVEEQKTHAEASLACSQLSGHLLTIDSHVDSERTSLLLRQHYPSITDILIGLEYYSNYGDYSYTNNKQPLTGYTNWLESNATEGNKECVVLSSEDEYKWKPVPCSRKAAYICEVPVCESTFESFNSSCYWFDNSEREFPTLVDTCAVKERRSGIVWVTNEQETTYLENVFNSRFGAGTPVFIGLHRYDTDYILRWVHNEWIYLDRDELYEPLGCYNSFQDDTIHSLENNSCRLEDDASQRSDPAMSCWYAARALNNQVFVLKEDGECHSDANAALTYHLEGQSAACINGNGGPDLLYSYKVLNSNWYSNLDLCVDGWYDGGGTQFHFWHDDDWKWLDSPVAGKGVCKVETCPQGFISFVNKCFKIINKLQTRNDSQNECQRYSAELYNPEYEDEGSFVSNILDNSGSLVDEMNLFWTGIFVRVLNESERYQVTGKRVVSSYNLHYLGASLMVRSYPEFDDSVTVLEMRYTFSSAGVVHSWEYYGSHEGISITFLVLRPIDVGQCMFTTIGSNDAVTEEGYQTVEVDVSERIQVEKGDYVAVFMETMGAIKFTWNDGLTATCTSVTSRPSVGGQLRIGSVPFRKSVSSFRALWRPDTFLQDSPFVTHGPTEHQCFAANYSSGTSTMSVHNHDCTDRLFSICEIKKYNRM